MGVLNIKTISKHKARLVFFKGGSGGVIIQTG